MSTYDSTKNRAKTPNKILRRAPLAAAISLALCAGAALSSPSVSASDVVQGQKMETASHFNIYRDPVTGQFGSPPASTTSSPPLDLSVIQSNLSTSSEGLKEESAMKGKMVRLNGRFQDATIVTVDTDSNIVPTPQSSASIPVIQNFNELSVNPTIEERKE